MYERVKLGIRWTIGDVSTRGFEALRLSVWGARQAFGPDAAYVICANSVPIPDAIKATGELPHGTQWRDASDAMAASMRPCLDLSMAEGVGWKFAPIRVFPDRHEISFDNDCILWELPPSIGQWLSSADPGQGLIASDVRVALGQFEAACGGVPRNSGIRGLPPGLDFEAALLQTLQDRERATGQPVVLKSELDEQGLQVAALSRDSGPAVVTLGEVTICSPFHPHLPYPGRCGAHFVGINARHFPWNYYDRPADEWSHEFWNRCRPELYRNVGLEKPAINS
jgi:hypothetical protein